MDMERLKLSIESILHIDKAIPLGILLEYFNVDMEHFYDFLGIEMMDGIQNHPLKKPNLAWELANIILSIPVKKRAVYKMFDACENMT